MSENFLTILVNRKNKQVELKIDISKMIPADDADFYTIEENDEFLCLPEWIQTASKSLMKVEVPDEVIKFLKRSPCFTEDHENVLQASMISSEAFKEFEEMLSEEGITNTL